jgi:hypothetical protein
MKKNVRGLGVKGFPKRKTGIVLLSKTPWNRFFDI